MAAVSVGQEDIWGTRFDAIVKGYSYEAFKLKNVCKVVPSSNWTEKFYQETATELTGGTGSAVKGVPRLAAFPTVTPLWTLVSTVHQKYGAECTISWEDVMTNQFDTIARVLEKTARAVGNAVDLAIYAELTGATGINTTASTAPWAVGGATGAPITDITVAIRKCAEAGYNVHEGGYLLLSPLDYETLLQHLFAKGAQAPTVGNEVTENGVVGTICGLKILVSVNVTADEAMVIISQKAATWQQAAPLQTATIVNQGVNYVVRAWEAGVLQVTDPKAIATITNTQT